MAGFQVPLLPLSEFAGRIGAAAPVQIAWTREKIGATFGVTVIVKVAVVAH